MRAEEAAAAGDRDAAHSCSARSARSQSTRPIQRSRFSAYQRIVRRTPSSHEIFGCPAGLAMQLLVADAQRHHVGHARPEPLRIGDDMAVGRPEAVLGAGREDQVAPVGHRDVRALAVDVEVARAPRVPRRSDARGRRRCVKQKSRSGSSAPSSTSGRVERLRDDRPGDVARVLARPVVVEHARHDAGDAVGVVVVHREEVGGHLRGRVDRLRVDRRALVQDQAARARRSRAGARPTRARCRTPPTCRPCRTSPARRRSRRSTAAGSACRSCSPSPSRRGGARTRRRAPVRRGGRRTACRAPARGRASGSRSTSCRSGRRRRHAACGVDGRCCSAPPKRWRARTRPRSRRDGRAPRSGETP